MAWNVDSVSALPSRPASDFIVGVQSPKSRPDMVEAWKPGKTPMVADEDAASWAEEEAVPLAATQAASVKLAATEAADSVELATAVIALELDVAATVQSWGCLLIFSKDFGLTRRLKAYTAL